jgi:hypothetical protein
VRREEERDVSKQETEEEGPRSFAHTMATICDGELNSAASEELHAAVKYLEEEAAGRRSKVKGKFKLEIDLQVDDNGTVLFAYSIKTKVPEPRRQAAVMWITKGGNLSTENPRQTKLPLREVSSRREPAREVEDTAHTKEA